MKFMRTGLLVPIANFIVAYTTFPEKKKENEIKIVLLNKTVSLCQDHRTYFYMHLIAYLNMLPFLKC